jgi:hypothetical protein
VDLFTPQLEPPAGGSFFNTAGLDATHMFGTVATGTVDPQATLPGSSTATNTFTFNQSWEGMVVATVVGTVLSADAAVNVSATGSAGVLYQYVNAAGTAVLAKIRCRALPGTTITPTITATTVSAVAWSFASASYNALS